MSSDRHDADEMLIFLLASGHTILAAAQMAGVSDSTVTRRLRSRRFRARLQAMRTRLIEQGVSALAAAMTEAAQKLLAIMRQPVQEGAQTAMQAAKAILTTGGDLWKHVELAVRLDDVKATLERLKEEHPEWFREDPSEREGERDDQSAE